MRIRWLIVAIVVLLCATGCDWEQFRFGPEHLGWSPDTSISVSTVGSLHLAWKASPVVPPFVGPLMASPVVAAGVVYVPTSDAILHAYDAAGVRQCTGGTPKTCTDLWTGVDAFGAGRTSAAVAGDFVYVGSDAPDVYVFDRGCVSICNYTWIAQVQDSHVVGSPVVADGVLFVMSDNESGGTLHAYDAAGAPASCDPPYHICPPVWTAHTVSASSPAVAGGVVYVGTTQGLAAFDAAGVAGCSGTPTVCQPLWTAPTSEGISSVAVTGGRAYARTRDGVAVFDATGANNCSGTPLVCQPLWTASTGGSASLPAIAGNVLYLGGTDGKLYAFDARGITGCSDTVKHCNPLWTAATGDSVDSAPSVANGVVYVGSDDTKLYAFDAKGQTGCSNTPKTCTPLWTGSTGGAVNSSPAIANGFVYVSSDDGILYAFNRG